MFGRNLTSLTCVTFCFFFDSCSFFFFSKVNLPKSITLQTGGSACSAITTTSSPSARPRARAAWGSTTPTCSPVEEISRTAWNRRMYSLIGEFFCGGIRGPPLKKMALPPSVGGRLGGRPGRRAGCGDLVHLGDQRVEQPRPGVPAAVEAERYRPRRPFLLPDHQ